MREEESTDNAMKEKMMMRMIAENIEEETEKETLMTIMSMRIIQTALGITLNHVTTQMIVLILTGLITTMTTIHHMITGLTITMAMKLTMITGPMETILTTIIILTTTTAM